MAAVVVVVGGCGGGGVAVVIIGGAVGVAGGSLTIDLPWGCRPYHFHLLCSPTLENHFQP